MTFLVELILVATLLLLMYEKPRALVDFSHTTLGKIVMILMIVVVAKMRGLVGGLLAALIMVVLMHTFKESLTGATVAIKSDGTALECVNDKDCGPCMCHSKCDNTSGKAVCTMKYMQSPWRETMTDRMTQENMVNRAAEEATAAASKQSNDHTSNHQDTN